MRTRELDELIVSDCATWPELTRMLVGHPESRVLEPDPDQARDTLWRLQVTTASMLGTVALHCGAILAEHGWFRILGAGVEGLPGLADTNQIGPPGPDRSAPAHLVIGYNVLGGQLAIDGGGLGIKPGEVCYFAPDALEWQGLGGGYEAFVEAAVTSGLAETFASLRWPTWQDDITDLPLRMSVASYPPPFSQEGRDLSQTHKNPVPTAELVDFYTAAAAQLSG